MQALSYFIVLALSTGLVLRGDFSVAIGMIDQLSYPLISLAGIITMDGTPVEQFGSTYGCMTVVRQEAVLFQDTLRSNLTIYQEMPDSSLLEALKNVGLDRYAGRERLDSILVEGGANFSGGEKKRICLARALLRETNVLILDEPLENLDDAAANKIEDLLLSIEGKILLIVSHRFSEAKLGMFDRGLKLEKVMANN